MRNKGSQAMFLSLYFALKSYYKDCEVVGFANKYDAPEQYSFKLLPYDSYTRLIFKYRLSGIPLVSNAITKLVGGWRKSDKWNGKVSQLDKAVREADAIFDASGYTLGSGWGKKGGEILLQTISIAKRYNKPIILMPQSFGPFDWPGEDNTKFIKKIGEELSYCLKIYAREKEGYECLTSLGLENVELSTDMVIRERYFPSARDIHAFGGSRISEYPAKGSVGLILNENVFRIGDADHVSDLYVKILERLLQNGEQVYILNTSTADNKLVQGIIDKAKASESVRLISGEYSSPDLIDIMSKFKYIVASRYHSIIFGYRSAVPAVILGWACKYTDLAEHFDQQDYVFDIREPGADRIVEKIDKMGANYEIESLRIKERLEALQATSVVQDAISRLNGGSSPVQAAEGFQLSGNRAGLAFLHGTPAVDAS